MLEIIQIIFVILNLKSVSKVTQVAIKNLKSRVLEIIDSTDSKILKFKMKNGIETLKEKISTILFKELEKHLAEYVTKEILEIKESLRGDCFFNLTNAPVSKDLREKLNLGKKYSPVLKINKGKELKLFEQEIANLFRNYMKSEFKLEISLSTKNISKDLNKMVKYVKRTRNSELEKFLNKF